MKKKVYLFAILFYIIDVVTKLLIFKSGNVYFSKEIIPSFFYLHLSKNTGGAFSILSSYTFVLAIIAIGVLIYIDRVYIKENISKLQTIGIALLIGGIAGNLMDRLFRGFVIDFLSFIIFGYQFPIFNLADIFITFGASILIFDMIRSEINENKSRRAKS